MGAGFTTRVLHLEGFAVDSFEEVNWFKRIAYTVAIVVGWIICHVILNALWER